MRKWRNMTRLAVILGMVWLVYFNLYEKKAGQLGAEEEISASIVLSAYDKVFGQDNQPMLFRGDMEGGLWSFRFFSFSLSDPLVFVTATASSWSIEVRLLMSILPPLLLLVLLGRFFCSWICPYPLFAEAGKGLAKILRRIGLEFFDLDLPKQTALFFLILSLALGAGLSLPVTTLIYPPRIITEGIYHLAVYRMVTAGLVFVVFLWLAELIFSPYLFCRRLCPGGALFSLLGRWRLWRITKIATACDMCGVCTPVCPQKLKPATGQFPGACDNCGLCIDACRDSGRRALKYTWSARS